MPELWELCNPKSRATLGYLFKQEQGYWPDWDDRAAKVVEPKKATYDLELEPEADTELVREMQLTPHSPRHIA